ncbi:hypothetical protein J2X31_000960 [Flavobacterium arsenatis]|uniref:Peptidase S8 n=1 Tax=Flavobacterium arsenatis TaxID=1484332 RepID=A0ABU1TLW6_9FLAO|nr:S8 family serine peptidase [Flavobacterium arsenatis]MDR6966960.1 hypothetical protein [Flavobacterium arsenatis]
MNKSIFFGILLTTSLGLAQSENDREKISKSYNVERLEEVKSLLKKKEELRNARIENYIARNTSIQRAFQSNGVGYDLLDIIDDKPIYRATDNASCALASKTNSLYPGGELGLSLEGENMIVGVWDEGYARKAHTEFLNNAVPPVTRVSTPDTPNPNPATNLHGTHVTGTVGARGANASAKGMAPKATLKSYNWTNDETEATLEAAAGLLISNHSYGVPIVNDAGVQTAPAWMMGCYDSNARDWDLISYAAPYYLMVASAGNNGTTSYVGGLMTGYDKLTTDKNAKNNLVVANANPTLNPVTGQISNLVLNSTSSQGPSDDGRIKPDITTKGTSVLSTSNVDNTTYTTLTGTSMASPNAAGSLLLLQEHYHNLNDSYMRASTLKGLVCHTALDDNQRIGPDARFGWGFLDAKEAAQTITKDLNNEALILELELNALNPSYTTSFFVSNPEKLKATICWTDPAGNSQSNVLNSSVPALMNDLDLRITNGTETFFPWKLQLSNVSLAAIKGDNVVDNVERVDVSSTVTGQYTLTVTHKNSLISGSQNFSLILTGTGISLNRAESEFKALSIFPNPTNNILNFSIGNLAEINSISIIDVTGKVITPKFDLNAKTIDVSSLQSGVYFVRFDSEGQSLTRKFIKI